MVMRVVSAWSSDDEEWDVYMLRSDGCVFKWDHLRGEWVMNGLQLNPESP